MPKAKPDVVYIHRIEAGEWERKNVLKPIAEIGQTVKIIKTAAFVAVPILGAGALYVTWWTLDAIYGWIEPMKEKLEALSQRVTEAKQHREDNRINSVDDLGDATTNPFSNDGYAEDGGPTNIFGLPGWGIWPGVL